MQISEPFFQLIVLFHQVSRLCVRSSSAATFFYLVSDVVVNQITILVIRCNVNRGQVACTSNVDETTLNASDFSEIYIRFISEIIPSKTYLSELFVNFAITLGNYSVSESNFICAGG